MESRAFTTPLGEIRLSGEPQAFDGAKPVVLVIKGAFAVEGGPYANLHLRLPEAAVLLAQLPGHYAPPLAETSIEAFAAAFGHVIRTVFADRRVVVWGESLGGLVALAIEAPNVRRLLLDPPLHTGKLWPSAPNFRRIYERHPEHRTFLANVLGVTAEGVEDRDYTGLFGRPARMLIGDVPLWPPRAFETAPSVLDDADRQFLAGRPEIELTVLPGVGHTLFNHARTAVLDAARALLNP